jgi:transcriptional regulator with XRE-family HTH domain
MSSEISSAIGVIPYHARDYSRNTDVIQGDGTIFLMDTIGARLKWARKQRKLTQAQLAEMAGVVQGTVGNLEAGIRDNPRAMVALCRALRVNPHWADTGNGEWDATAQAQALEPLTPQALRVASWFDRLKDERARATVESVAMTEILAQLRLLDPQPKPAPGSTGFEETQSAEPQSLSSDARKSLAKTQADPAAPRPPRAAPAKHSG